MSYFKVVNKDTNGTINEVRTAPSERPSDPKDVREAKRKARAEHLRNEWIRQPGFVTKNLQVMRVESAD